MADLVAVVVVVVLVAVGEVSDRAGVCKWDRIALKVVKLKPDQLDGWLWPVVCVCVCVCVCLMYFIDCVCTLYLYNTGGFGGRGGRGGGRGRGRGGFGSTPRGRTGIQEFKGSKKTFD